MKSVSTGQFSFDRFGQMVPCPDRDICSTYKIGCDGQRKWCQMDLSKIRKEKIKQVLN